MTRLAEYCPELDGGTIFLESNPTYDPDRRRCTLGLGHALVELHLDQVLRLHCPPDSDGWDIREAAARRDARYLRSERIDRVEWLPGEEAAYTLPPPGLLGARRRSRQCGSRPDSAKRAPITFWPHTARSRTSSPRKASSTYPRTGSPTRRTFTRA